VIIYTLLALHLQKNENAAWSMIENTNIPLGDNLLNYFIAATVASHTGKNEKVIAILSQKPSGGSYYPFPLLDFLLGNAMLNKLDSNADDYIKKFIAVNKGRAYMKEANRKLAWFYLINDNPVLYRQYMQHVLELNSAPTDEDKSAQKEAEQNYIPNKLLLKSRILFDGAYYDKSLALLNTIHPEKLTRSRDAVEYYYRKARLLDALNNTSEAVKFYLLTIQKGAPYNYYFAANACIKVAGIFEQQHKKQYAEKYYRKAIELDKDEYANSIDAEAKAGLNRLGS
jgi:hypothetical protein